MIAALNAHLLIFDNLSRIRPKESDDFCQFCNRRRLRDAPAFYRSGSSAPSMRERPVIIAKVLPIGHSRTCATVPPSVRLVPIAERDRRTEQELWRGFCPDPPVVARRSARRAFDRATPSGALGAVTRLRPRMADGYIWSLTPPRPWGSLPTCCIGRGRRRVTRQTRRRFESSAVR